MIENVREVVREYMRMAVFAMFLTACILVAISSVQHERALFFVLAGAVLHHIYNVVARYRQFTRREQARAYARGEVDETEAIVEALTAEIYKERAYAQPLDRAELRQRQLNLTAIEEKVDVMRRELAIQKKRLLLAGSVPAPLSRRELALIRTLQFVFMLRIDTV